MVVVVNGKHHDTLDYITTRQTVINTRYAGSDGLNIPDNPAAYEKQNNRVAWNIFRKEQDQKRAEKKWGEHTSATDADTTNPAKP